MTYQEVPISTHSNISTHLEVRKMPENLNNITSINGISIDDVYLTFRIFKEVVEKYFTDISISHNSFNKSSSEIKCKIINDEENTIKHINHFISIIREININYTVYSHDFEFILYNNNYYIESTSNEDEDVYVSESDDTFSIKEGQHSFLLFSNAVFEGISTNVNITSKDYVENNIKDYELTFKINAILTSNYKINDYIRDFINN